MVEFRNIVKRFAGVTAVDDVSIAIEPGECHGLMGENGAGKSTLGKILAGIYRPDSGTVFVGGSPQAFRSPADAMRAGVSMVHQELAFCPDLSVAENLCMGAYPRRAGILLHRREMRARARNTLARIDVELDVDRPMRSLSTAQEQMVQIASAVARGSQVIVFDEPTSSLSEPEAQRLFRLIEQLRASGTTVIYVSHRMPEVFRLCDRISVLRDGRAVGTLARAEASHDALVRMMVGRSVTEFRRTQRSQDSDIALSVSGLSSPGKFERVGFEVRKGEILGFAGLVGAGRSEIAQAIFGLDRRARGSVSVFGEALPRLDVRSAKRAGIGLVPEDRKRQGLVLQMTARQNVSLAVLDRLSRLGVIDSPQEREITRRYFERLRVKAGGIDAVAVTLSGGNQQKLVIAKWLARNARVLIVDEPTRGVDVGAKASIHELIDELAAAGVAILLISSELPELLALSDRIVVLREGRQVATVNAAEASQESVLRLMAGIG